MTDADGLKARLAAMRERQARAEHDRKFEQFARSVPILCALEEAGEPFESGGYDRLAGQANQWVHDPDGGSFTVNTVQPVSRLNGYARVSDALGSFLKSTENITIILGTKPGERQMLPQFGCRIHELLFAPDTKATSSAIAHHVEEALRRWEKRIEVEKVDAKIESQGAVRVTVDYRVVATGAVQSMGYTVRSR